MTSLPESLVRYEHELAAAIRRDVASRRRRRGTRLALLAAAAAVGAVAAAVVLPGGGASAADRAAAALRAKPGAILHVVVTGTRVDRSGDRVPVNEESWEQVGPPFAFRQLELGPHGVVVADSLRTGTRVELYDPARNTIYRAGGAHVQVRRFGAPPAGRAPSRLIIVTPLAAWDPLGPPIAAMLARGVQVKQVGPHAIELRGPHGVYTVRPRSFTPLSWRSPRGSLRFRTFEQLPSTAANRALFDLEAAHPGARVDTSREDFRAARLRLLAR